MKKKNDDLQLHKSRAGFTLRGQKEGTNKHSENRLKVVLREKNNELHQLSKQESISYA